MNKKFSRYFTVTIMALSAVACSSLEADKGRSEKYADRLKGVQFVCIRSNPSKPAPAVHEAFVNSFAKHGIRSKTVTDFFDPECTVQLVNGIRLTDEGYIKRGTFTLLQYENGIRHGLGHVAYALRGDELKAVGQSGVQGQTDRITAALLNRSSGTDSSPQSARQVQETR